MKYPLIVCFAMIFMAFVKDEKITDKVNTNPYVKWNKAWDDPRYLAANTAKNSRFLNSKEKEFIYLLNLARMNPVLFGQTLVKQYPDSNNQHYLRNVTEYKSLLEFLAVQKPMPILFPDSLCWESAKCHAISSGEKDYVGHKRQSPDCEMKSHFKGECCYYGNKAPLDVLLSLIIDQDVPSLGHRKICFSAYYNKAGVSFQPHSTYGTNVVIDFY